ncbi:hypothetical protein SELMODRAFT_417405 [Selaginella moellendorffii]|uniref:Uncharacterized protein n=1 Tax=Selaginella moellendorffii TaxID=88036 RepID=D8S243_SELML|nr:hypothetical protein SELMODRAFT_417405 [Selaginella moellendorffii]
MFAWNLMLAQLLKGADIYLELERERVGCPSNVNGLTTTWRRGAALRSQGRPDLVLGVERAHCRIQRTRSKRSFVDSCRFVPGRDQMPLDFSFGTGKSTLQKFDKVRRFRLMGHIRASLELSTCSTPQALELAFTNLCTQDRLPTADSYLIVASRHLERHIDSDFTSVFATRIDALGLEEACRQIAGTETDDCRTFQVVPVGELLRQKVANGVTQEVTGQLHSAAEDKEEGPIELYMDEFEAKDEDESGDKDESEDEDERLDGFDQEEDLKLVCKVGSCKLKRIKNGHIMESDGVNDAIVYPVGEIRNPFKRLPASQIIATQGPKYFIDWETEAAMYLGLTYRDTISFACEEGVKHIALPAILRRCRGFVLTPYLLYTEFPLYFRFPLDKVAAVESVQKALKSSLCHKGRTHLQGLVAATDLLAFTDYDGYVSCWSTGLPFSYTSEGIPTYDPSHCGQKKCPLKSAEK